MKEKIEKIIREYVRGTGRYLGHSGSKGALYEITGSVKAAAAIAAMVEEELDKQPALVVARMASLQARLAETTTVLDWLFDWIDDISDILPLSAEERQPALVKIEQALAASPVEAVWRGRGQSLQTYEDNEPIISIVAASTYDIDAFCLQIFGRPKELERAKVVTVTVTVEQDAEAKKAAE